MAQFETQYQLGPAQYTVAYYLLDAMFTPRAIGVGKRPPTPLAVLRQYTFEPYGELFSAEEKNVGPVEPLFRNSIGHQGLFFERLIVDPNEDLFATRLTPGATGLYYNRNRWYHPRLGRFMSRDQNETAMPLLAALAMNGQAGAILTGAMSAAGQFADGMSLYGYTGGNPIGRRDPLGLYYDPFEEVDEFTADRLGHAMYQLGTLNEMAKIASLGLRTAVSIAWGFLPGSGLYDAFQAIEVLRSGKGGFWEAMDIALVAFPLAKKGIEGVTAFRGMLRAGVWAERACNCFVAGTLVVTAAGEVPIESVKVGDLVLATLDRNAEAHPQWSVVTRVFVSEAPETLTLTLEDGETLRLTPEHEVWTFEEGWQPAREIALAEHLRGLDDAPLAVISVEFDPTPRTVYNLEVDDARTYYADGVWVHNNSCSLTHLHHMLPREFADRFQALGLNVEEFRIPLSAEFHRQIHGKGGTLAASWNGRWAAFWSKYPVDGPQPTPQEVMLQHALIVQEFLLGP